MADSKIKLTKADRFKAFLRSYFLLASFNYERMQNGGVAYTLIPAIKKLYQTKEERVAALKRHLEFFNTTPQLATLILGISAAMEESNANDPEFDTESINSVKVSLMGPLAGIGDTLFWTLLPTIMGSIAGYMALEGNPIGVILWLIVNLIFICIRTQLMWIGYREGTKLITKVGSKLARITDAASVLGLTVVGALSATVVTAKTPLAFQMGEVNLAVADLLDKIMPSMISVATVLVLYKLLGKKGMKITTLILIVIIFSMICSALGILA